MGAGEGLVPLAIAAIVICIAIASAEIVKRFLRYKERQLELTADRTAEKAAQYAAHVEKLEERMRVLERIATDKGVDVAAQIEGLRDVPSPVRPASEEVN